MYLYRKQAKVVPDDHSSEYRELSNKIYATKSLIGAGSIHFSPSEDRPYISFENLNKILSDGTVVEKRKFDKGWSFSSETRQFKGQITWSPNTYQGHSYWNCDFTFSKKFDHIKKGTIIQRFEDEDVEDSIKRIPKDIQYNSVLPKGGYFRPILVY